ncbi:MAG: methyltransferase domain-containing protein [bacterium]|nr:methyltransferase domain-containing protein [bacterium]
MKQWYEELFTDYAETYEKESFTQGTTGEVDFLEKEVGRDKTVRILDIGCGTGRHSVELAKRGYNVTGIDLSESQLKKAREKAAQSGLKIDFIRGNARDFSVGREFGLAIMICEGAFSLMETDEMNYKILECASRSLKKNGKFIFSCLNALFPLFHSVKDFLNAHARGEPIQGNTFDLMTFRNSSRLTVKDDKGAEKTLSCNERYFAPSEIAWHMRSLGFAKTDIYSCRLGAFSREHPLTPDDYEMLVIAEK